MNPLADIDLVRDSERELVFLTKEQIAPFLDKVRKDNSPSAEQIYIACKICLATGARIGEDLNLKRSQVNKHKLLFTETKGKTNRSVPISATLHSEIVSMISDHVLFDVRYYAAWE